MKTRNAPYRVLLLAHEHMNLLDLSGPLQALVTASRFVTASGEHGYETIFASALGGEVVTGAGLAIMTVPLATVDSRTIDTLIVPGGCHGDEFFADPVLVTWLAAYVPNVLRVCSICTGAFLLAASGHLNGRRVTTHWDWVGRLKKMHPAVEPDSDRRYIQDGAIWTSAGVTAGIELTLALIEEDFDHRIAVLTARQLVMCITRPGAQSQCGVSLREQSTSGTRFVQLHAWMAAHLQMDLTIARLALQAGMAPRTFARIYTAHHNRTPSKAVEAMRVELACRELEETSRPLKTIARIVGFSSEEILRRAFRRQFGITPAQYRARFVPLRIPYIFGQDHLSTKGTSVASFA